MNFEINSSPHLLVQLPRTNLGGGCQPRAHLAPAIALKLHNKDQRTYSLGRYESSGVRIYLLGQLYRMHWINPLDS